MKVFVLILAVLLVGCALVCDQLPTLPVGVINPLCPAPTPTLGPPFEALPYN